MDKNELARLVHGGEVLDKRAFDGLDLAGADLGGGFFTHCSFKGANVTQVRVVPDRSANG